MQFSMYITHFYHGNRQYIFTEFISITLLLLVLPSNVTLHFSLSLVISAVTVMSMFLILRPSFTLPIHAFEVGNQKHG